MARKRKQEQQPPEEPDTLTRIREGKARTPATPNPLSREHLDRLNQVIEECSITAEMCAKCKDAGVDVEPEMKLNSEQLDMAIKLKRAFFPHES